MNIRMRKRLDKIEESILFDETKNAVVFVPLEDESDRDYDDRIKRWKAGEMVEGQHRTYTGNEPRVITVRFVESVPRQD